MGKRLAGRRPVTVNYCGEMKSSDMLLLQVKLYLEDRLGK